MAEREDVFSSKLKSGGFFSFKDVYVFCYKWLTEEVGLEISEDKYTEKVKGDKKEIEIEWSGEKKYTDYFKFDSKVKFKVTDLIQVEIVRDGSKIKTQQGTIELSVKGILVRDYQGKFDQTPTKKFWRGIYEKFVIPSNVKAYKDKIAQSCDDFLSQTKAFLDLEGKR